MAIIDMQLSPMAVPDTVNDWRSQNHPLRHQSRRLIQTKMCTIMCMWRALPGGHVHEILCKISVDTVEVKSDFGRDAAPTPKLDRQG